VREPENVEREMANPRAANSVALRPASYLAGAARDFGIQPVAAGQSAIGADQEPS